MADLSALDEDREIRFVSPESSIGIAKIQKLIARSIFSSGMKRNFYRDQFLIFLKFIFLRQKRIIYSLFSIIYRFSLFFGKGAVSKMVKSRNVANISYLMI
ncbi:hypothetical protein ABWR62_08400 [Enterococcus faecium]|nr:MULTISPECIES: hypothetical protein [Enterococcus]EGP4944075.1 hypothetical protein [Enterococcus faecium]EGP4997976.1 hypothetical protein [Enterococcus faecium]EGP5078835.1 hypothetical protein [Enterococcus faecium]EGP5600481.1 hypothetical protein [Enterococcus faecium]EGP5628195.1 hypothetical protein [Enterococcus faecium]